MGFRIKQILIFLIAQTVFAQVQEEVSPPENIKSIIFRGPTEDQFPIVRFGESIQLEFDDLLANEQDYYYKIVHCNYDWTLSDILKSQYLRGMDNQRIIDYENSYTTLQPYSNYRLQLPNDNIKFRVSGNYLIEVYNSNDEIQFSRRFVIYKNLVQVGAQIKRTRDFNFLNEKQVVQFSINTANFPVVNPKKEVKVVLLQNYFWPTAIYDVKPQFTLGRELVYKYDQETSFFGGNEYFNFDNSDIELEDIYNHYLFTNEYRYQEPYTFFPDINGDFQIRTLQGVDSSREAEYTKVHFSLPYTDLLGLDNVYIFGKFNNYAITEENKMVYNEENGLMEATLILKQGFYNYKYVIERNDGTVDLNMVGGNFHFTENNYQILVYYRNFGDMYDSLIGIGNANSRNITN